MIIIKKYFEYQQEVTRQSGFAQIVKCWCGKGEKYLPFKTKSRGTIFEETFYACINCGRVHSMAGNLETKETKKDKFKEIHFNVIKVWNKQISEEKLKQLKLKFKKELKEE